METRTLTSTNAFVAIDLPDAEVATGPVRCARKILTRGAEELARSQTYTYAAMGMERSGASAGINAEGDARDGAVAAFVEEVAGWDEPPYLPDAAKGVDETDLAPLRESDPRDRARTAGEPSLTLELEGVGPAIAAEVALGSLEGRTAVIEGFDAAGPVLAGAIGNRGGRVIGVSTSAGAAAVDDDTSLGLTEAWAEHGPDMVTALAGGDPAWKVFTYGADIVFAGSKMGVITHESVARWSGVAAVVPCGRLPFTARALAEMRKAGIVALPDFVTLAGPTLALWGDRNRTAAEIRAHAVEEIGGVTEKAMTDPDGPFLGACRLAEDFLLSWRTELPFGRPLAA